MSYLAPCPPPLSTALALALAATLVPLAPRPSQASPSLPAVGVQSHGMWSGQTDAERLKSLDLIAATGAGWVRLDFGWCSVEEAGSGKISDWYLERSDFVVNAARARGLKVLLTLWCTPSWANGGQPREVPPRDDADYASIARRMAVHFRGRVDAWEVWNEPNLNSFWQNGDPVRYAKLLRAAYPALKAGAPDTPVVFGGPAHNDVAFIRSAYDAGAKGAFDVMATHPYMGMGDLPPSTPATGGKWDYTLFVSVSAVRDLMVARGDGDKQIWFTEFGWSSHANWDGISNWQRGVTVQQQADYLIEALEIVRKNFPYVGPMIWYNDRAKATSDVHQAGYALFTRDYGLKPVYHALRDYLTTPGDGSPPPRDLEAPVAPSTPDLAAHSDSGVSSSDDRTNIASPTFTGTAEAGAIVRLLVDGVERGSGPADAQGAYRVVAGPLSDGHASVTATATDAAGNTSAASAGLALTVDTRAPIVHGPVTSLMQRSTLTLRNGARVDIRWSAIDDDEVAMYELQQSADGGATYADVALPSTTTTTASSLFLEGVRYRHRVRATDSAGNASGYSRGNTFESAVVQEGDGAVTADAWSAGLLADASADAVRHTRVGGSVARFDFMGRRVAWVAQSSSGRGRAEVWLDGVKKATIDLYSESTRPRLLQYTATVDPSIPHRLEVRVLGKRNRRASSTRVDVDAFVVLS